MVTFQMFDLHSMEICYFCKSIGSSHFRLSSTHFHYGLMIEGSELAFQVIRSTSGFFSCMDPF
ncbi:hypothetical protein ACSBR2_040250 [Camellia fascicularis]